MKVFSFFTKTGKIDVPIADQKVAEANQIAKNPLIDLQDKLREMADLSNRLVKQQTNELRANDIEKMEFTDVDGSKKTLIKGKQFESCVEQVEAKGTADSPEAVCQASVGIDKAKDSKKTPEELAEFETERKEHPDFTDAQIWQIVSDHMKKKEAKDTVDALRDITGKLQKGGPGSGRHPEGEIKPEIDDPFVSRAHVGSDVPMHQSTAEAIDAQESKKPNSWEAKTPKNPEPEKLEEPKDPMADHKKIAMEHAKTNVPLKHQGSAKAYINSDSFKDDVARHDGNRQKEIANLGYSQGPHPAVRALNEHMHPLMSKAEQAEFEKVLQDDLEKVGWTDEAREAAAQARTEGSGGSRINGKDAASFVDRRLAFTNTNGQMYGKTHPNGVYAVHSYGSHFPIYAHDGVQWHGNSDHYSVTTSKHQNWAKPSGNIKYHNTQGMQNIVSGTKKSLDSIRDLAGKIVKGGPGSGRTPEGGAGTDPDPAWLDEKPYGGRPSGATEGKLFTHETAQGVIDRIHNEVKVPHISATESTLGGKDRPSIMVTLSQDPKEKWANGILQNSRYAHLSVDPSGTVEHFSGSVPHVRQKQVKDVNGLIEHLNSKFGTSK